MLALRPDIVEAVWQAVAGHLPVREEKPPALLPPQARAGSRLLRGDPVPPRHRLQLPMTA